MLAFIQLPGKWEKSASFHFFISIFWVSLPLMLTLMLVLLPRASSGFYSMLLPLLSVSV